MPGKVTFNSTEESYTPTSIVGLIDGNATGTYSNSEYGYEPIKRDDPSYLGDEFNAIIIGITLVLGAGGVILNLGIMTFYWEKVKSLVPFLYFILSTSDFVTALCAIGHSIIFSAILALKNSGSNSILWLIVPCYFITEVTFKVSAFVSTVFAVIRTINIATPLIKMRRRPAVISIFVWLAVWLTVSSLHLWIFVKLKADEGYSSRVSFTERIGGEAAPSFSHVFLIGYFYQPNKGNFFQSDLMEGVLSKIEQGKRAVVNECLISMGYTVSPVILCATIILIATIIQVVLLLRTDTLRSGRTDPEEELRRNRKISVTIIQIGTLFIVCSVSTLYHPLWICFVRSQWERDIDSSYYQKMYASSYIPYFLNAALNPFILVQRASRLRQYMWSILTMNNRFR
jgi:hypothetical protein